MDVSLVCSPPEVVHTVERCVGRLKQRDILHGPVVIRPEHSREGFGLENEKVRWWRRHGRGRRRRRGCVAAGCWLPGAVVRPAVGADAVELPELGLVDLAAAHAPADVAWHGLAEPLPRRHVAMRAKWPWWWVWARWRRRRWRRWRRQWRRRRWHWLARSCSHGRFSAARSHSVAQGAIFDAPCDGRTPRGADGEVAVPLARPGRQEQHGLISVVSPLDQHVLQRVGKHSIVIRARRGILHPRRKPRPAVTVGQWGTRSCNHILGSNCGIAQQSSIHHHLIPPLV
eukprot:COSAG01_NODE_829_length_13273_cov_7.729695_2_plen_285_part_00